VAPRAIAFRTLLTVCFFRVQSSVIRGCRSWGSSVSASLDSPNSLNSLNSYMDDGLEPDGNRWRRVKVTLIGALIALIAGITLSFVYTSVRYGGSPLDGLFGRKRASAVAGKLAYDRNTHLFIGIIKSEGYSVKRATQVYYIERSGGEVIELPKSLVEARDRSAQ
jgi:hypothetical protein